MRLSAAALVMVLAAFPMRASAADPVDPITAQATEHFKKGTSAYRVGDMDEAVTELKAAVKLKAAPNGIFALGQALREKGELAAAAHEYRQYLILAPKGPFADQSQSFLKDIETTLATTRKTQTAPPQGVPAEPPVIATPEPAVIVVKPEPPAQSTAPAPVIFVDTPPTKRPIYKRWWLWTAIVGGAAIIATGVAIGITQSKSHETSFQVHAP